MSEMVVLKNVSKTYKRGNQSVNVLHDVSLSVKQGDFVALMGPSGSGKTTLLNLMAGLDLPTSGDVTVEGKRISSFSASRLAEWRANHVGIIFQFYHLLPVLSAARNVEIPLLLSNLSAAERRKRVDVALKLVGLSERASHKPSELSGGQQQRVAIARAIVADPKLLVCDEPTGDLDRETAEGVLDLLRTLNKTTGVTIVMVTHDPRAADAASRQILLDKGMFVEGLRSAA